MHRRDDDDDDDASQRSSKDLFEQALEKILVLAVFIHTYICFIIVENYIRSIYANIKYSSK